MYGKVCKGTSKNSSTFKMELFATISNNRKLQRALSDGLTTNCLLTNWLTTNLLNIFFAKHTRMLDSTKNVVYTVFRKYMYLNFQQHLLVNINNRTRSKICSNLKRKTPERRQLTVCLCQLTLFWCLSLLILDIFHTIF